MLTVADYEKIRRAYYVEHKSMRQIARELRHSRKTIKKALAQAEPPSYELKEPRAAPVLGPYKAQINELMRQNEGLPPKQRYTAKRVYQEIQKVGYTGSLAGVQMYMWRQRKEKRRPKLFLPLEYDPGQDAQVDWGEAYVIMAGRRIKVQLFVMRLCYSRKIFVMAFPTQKQEAFFAGHVAAFDHFGGVPQRLIYDNLKAAVKRVLEGRNRQEQDSFILFRSHYLFDSRFCTPGQGHEKGGVEHGIGYARRNFMVPLPEVADFAQLNDFLRQAGVMDDGRRVARQSVIIHEAWQQELPYLRPLPDRAYDCCTQRTLVLNPYGQVEIDTNRYSVPADQAEAKHRVKIYPFQIEIYGSQADEPVAIHARCYERQQDILDPLHYLPLLIQRPGALEHAKPVRQWRQQWPACYERLLSHLQRQWPEGQGIRQFIRILQLHRTYPAGLIEQAVTQALEHHRAHLDGVMLCLNQLQLTDPEHQQLDLRHQPKLNGVGHQPVRLAHYNQLLLEL